MSNEFNPIFYIDTYFTNANMMGCGGGTPDPTVTAAEQQQLQFSDTLQNIFMQQYAHQQQILGYLQGQLTPNINAGGQGYTPTQLATQRTAATDVNAEQYQAAQAALNNQVVDNSGGSKLTGSAGATTEADAALLNAEAQTQAAAQENITTNNANLQQQNYWNAIGALSGVAQQENPLGYAGASSNAANAVANLGNANANIIKATSINPLNTFLSSFGGTAGGILGQSTGLGISGLFGCWIAASIYGWNSLKTWVLRFWLNTEAPTWFRKFYLSYGERIAQTPLRWAFFPVFELVLRTI